MFDSKREFLVFVVFCLSIVLLVRCWAWSAPVPPAKARPAPLVGTYQTTWADEHCKESKGTCAITLEGTTLVFSWARGTDYWEGRGTRVGKQIVVTWRHVGSTAKGEGLYVVHKNRITGTWWGMGEAGRTSPQYKEEMTK